MKPFFIDMRTIPMAIRNNVAELIIKNATGEETFTVHHASNDLLFYNSDRKEYIWYCDDGHNGIGFPTISLQDFADYGGPIPSSRPYETLEEASVAVGKIAREKGGEIFMITAAAIDNSGGATTIRLFAMNESVPSSRAMARWVFLDTGKPVGFEYK